MSIKIALVGAGHMGRIHLGKLIELEDVEVLGVVDVDRNALDNVYKNHRLPIYEDYKNISDIIDGVVISSPTESHYEMAKYFLERGVHVFIEKPITTEIAQGKELVEISDKLNLVLQIGLLERFNPAIKEAMKHIERPLFIEARRMSSFTGRSTDIDVVLDMMIHDIDLTLSVVKDDRTKDEEQKLKDVFGTRVAIVKRGNGAKVVFNFYSKEDFDQFMNKIEDFDFMNI